MKRKITLGICLSALTSCINAPAIDFSPVNDSTSSNQTQVTGSNQTATNQNGSQTACEQIECLPLEQPSLSPSTAPSAIITGDLPLQASAEPLPFPEPNETESPTPELTPSPEPTVEPTPEPSASVSVSPSPTAKPSAQPTPTPTPTPTPSGPIVSTFVGSSFGWQDGNGTSARFYRPAGLSFDSNGNLYVADEENSAIRKVSPTGEVTTLAGPVKGYVDGIGSAAQFRNPKDLAVDQAGNVYVADTGNNTIRKISPAGVVSTFAGNGQFGYVDATGTTARFDGPWGIGVDQSGNVYVADANNYRIRKITPAGQVSTLAGSSEFGYVDGTGSAARFDALTSLTVDINGNIYVTDQHRIRKITSAGVVSTLAGNGGAAFSDGVGESATFKSPLGLTADSTGNIYVADQANHRIRKISPSGEVITLAGLADFGYLDGVTGVAKFNTPRGIAIDSAGNLLISDALNNRIRRLSF